MLLTLYSRSACALQAPDSRLPGGRLQGLPAAPGRRSSGPVHPGELVVREQSAQTALKLVLWQVPSRSPDGPLQCLGGQGDQAALPIQVRAAGQPSSAPRCMLVGSTRIVLVCPMLAPYLHHNSRSLNAAPAQLGVWPCPPSGPSASTLTCAALARLLPECLLQRCAPGGPGAGGGRPALSLYILR